MVVASWMGTPVSDEALPPSDRGERSETFSLGGGGYPRGIAKGDAPLASFLPYLSRSKDRVGGFGGRSAPAYGRAGRSPATAEGRRSRPQARLAETTVPIRPRQRAENRQAGQRPARQKGRPQAAQDKKKAPRGRSLTGTKSEPWAANTVSKGSESFSGPLVLLSF